MSEIPEPVITETEIVALETKKVSKSRIIKRKSPKAESNSMVATTSLDAILAGQNEEVPNTKIVKETKAKAPRKSKAKIEENDNKVIDTSYLRVGYENLILELKQNPNKLANAKELLRTIDFAHDTLFKSNENISGLPAFNDITNFLFIKLLKPYLADNTENGMIDLFNPEHYKTIQMFRKDEKLPKLFAYFQDMNKLLSVNLEELRNTKLKTDTIREMGQILKAHPITGQIFQDENIITIKTPELVQSFLKACILDPPPKKEVKENDKEKKTKQSNIIDVDNLYNIEDGIGILYENFNSKYLNDSKGQGQFFTPRSQMDITIEYTKPLFEALLNNRKQNNKPFKLGDYCMGTGGWIVSIFNKFKNEYRDIFKIYGGDVNARTFQMGLMNIIITMGKLPKSGNVVCASSLTNITNDKMDVISINPPFITDLPFDVIEGHFNTFQETLPEEKRFNINDVYKLRSNSAPIQFTELTIYKLVDGGIGIIVYPNGDLFFGSNEGNIRFRKYLLDTVDLKAIITFPGGIYGHTSIKTIVLVFIKDSKGTSETAFLRVDANSNKQCEKMYEIAKVKKEDFLKHPNVSYKVEDYIKENELDYGCNVELKKLGDVCEIISKGKKRNASESKLEGKYKFLTCSVMGHRYGDIYDYEDEALIINSINGSGKCMIYIAEKYSLTNNNIHFKAKNNLVINRYLYYYLLNNIDKLERGFSGCQQKKISNEYLLNIKIPIPSLELQKEWINRFDLFITNTETINRNKITHFQESMKATISGVRRLNDLVIKKLGDVCNLIIGGTPSTKESDYYHNGTNLWVSVKELNNNIIIDTNKKLTDLGVKKSNVKLIKKGTILFSFKLSIGKTAIAGADLYTNEAIAGLVIKDNIIDNKYLYYYLMVNDYSKKGSGLIGNGSLNKESLSKLIIPIPSMETQKRLATFCDYALNQIKNLEDEIVMMRENILADFNGFLTCKEKINPQSNLEDDDEIILDTQELLEEDPEIEPLDQEDNHEDNQ